MSTESPVPRPREKVIQAGAEILWNKQFEGTAWDGKLKCINPESIEEYRDLALKVWRAMVAAEAVHGPNPTGGAPAPVRRHNVEICEHHVDRRTCQLCAVETAQPELERLRMLVGYLTYSNPQAVVAAIQKIGR